MEDRQKLYLQKAKESLTSYQPQQVEKVLQLLDEGNTVPFIARYRKDQTGSLDEVQIRDIQETYEALVKIEDRKASVIKSIADQGKLTDQLQASIENASSLQEVEDLYLPYKQKRRTKATIARENGLAPLADWLRTFPDAEPEAKAAEFIQTGDQAEILSAQDALDGAHEIMAEEVGDSAQYRTRVRQIVKYIGRLSSSKKRGAEDERETYQMYYEYSESLQSIQNHNILAMNRGEKEGVLTISLKLDDSQAIQYISSQEIPAGSDSPAVSYVRRAVEDAYRRFILPAIEREVRSQLTERAEAEAIELFGENLKNLLFQPPLKEQVIMGFDPAFRTGCKLAIIDGSGKLLAVDIIYPHEGASRAKRDQAGPRLEELIRQYQVETIAIGNGTASRESEIFVSEVIDQMEEDVRYTIVNEAGASVYSASEEARREFPDLQTEERSAVSIARRLQDPLAELVKIDPKSIGVGQYQHDVNEKELDKELDFVVETVVNQVGVNLNTASAALLKHVSGLTQKTAENVVAHREAEGPYQSRDQLQEVAGVGPKTYKQAVGFLRVPGSDQAFDNTGIHPESYQEAQVLLEDAGLTYEDMGSDRAKEALQGLDHRLEQEKTQLGTESYRDILDALIEPGRDMRDAVAAPVLRTGVLSMEDLQIGMELEGTVRNVVDFGAFVDIGVGQDGLVHVSKLSKKYINHPSDVVAVGDIVQVKVIELDLQRQRIGLSMNE